MKEALLEPFLRRQRIARVLPVIRRYPQCRLLDVGCGFEARLLRAVEPYVAKAVGVDQRAPEVSGPKLATVRTRLFVELPFDDGAFDVVTMLAVLEHLDRPEPIVREIRRVLAPGGRLVLTVPHHRAKPVLEFLAYRVGIVSEVEIRDHKRYWGRKELAGLFAEVGLRMETHRHFQVGFNNFAVAVRDQ